MKTTTEDGLFVKPTAANKDKTLLLPKLSASGAPSLTPPHQTEGRATSATAAAGGSGPADGALDVDWDPRLQLKRESVTKLREDLDQGGRGEGDQGGRGGGSAGPTSSSRLPVIVAGATPR